MSNLFARLLEKGRVLSKSNETKIRSAMQALQEVLQAVAGGLPMNEAQRTQFHDASAVLLEAELSHNQQRQAVAKALRASMTGTYCYVEDMYDTWLVYSCYDRDGETDQLYKVAYVIDDAGTVTFGPATAVVARTVYEPVATMHESVGELLGDYVPLVEAAVRRDGTVPIKVIAPGWGSSGYYPADVLERDGPKVFAKGLHAYWNHPTASEEAERPERDLRDLAGVLESGARWEANGVAGPGLYADLKVMPAFAGSVEALHEHIGMSIRASGRATIGEAEGRTGAIIQEIVLADSVDFVTKAGAGGQVLALFEAARGAPTRAAHPAGGVTGDPIPSVQEEPHVNEQEARELRESNTQLTTEVSRLREALMLREARELVTARLATHKELSEPTRQRLLESLSKQPRLKDGAIDTQAFEQAIDEAVTREIEYLATVMGSGRIAGMGSSDTTLEESGADDDLEASLAEAFGALGLSESATKIAVRGR